LLFILSITGIVLWPGWHKLASSFKIKWHGHIKRVNFDVHKAAGIVTTIFLALTGLTGFVWNFYPQVEPLLYAVTFTPKPTEPVSKAVPGRSILSLTEILQRVDAAIPAAKLTYLNLHASPKDVFQINKQFPGELDPYRSRIYLDRYTGEVLQLRDSRSLLLGDQVIDSFTPLHFCTFGGLPTRTLLRLAQTHRHSGIAVAVHVGAQWSADCQSSPHSPVVQFPVWHSYGGPRCSGLADALELFWRDAASASLYGIEYVVDQAPAAPGAKATPANE
jgi:uncharacterized iron-regulated membrane protein